MKKGKEKWRIVEVYAKKDLEEIRREMESWTDEREEGIRTIVGGGEDGEGRRRSQGVR